MMSELPANYLERKGYIIKWVTNQL
jgi:hypothetical protein